MEHNSEFDNMYHMKSIGHPDNPIRTEVDTSTGERRMSAPATGRYVIRDLKYKEQVKDRVHWRDYDQKYFTKCNMDSIGKGLDDVPKSYLSHLMYLQTFIDYKGILRLDNNHHMLRGDMLKMLKMSERTFKSFMSSMKEHDIIRAEKVNGKTIYSVNPEYHLRGESKNKNIIKGFIEEIRELYENHNSHDEIGAIYKLLPYVHFRNALVAKPYEYDIEDAEPLSLDDIAKIIGISKSSVQRFMRNLRLGKEYVFESTEGGGKYWINPRIFWRDSKRPDQTLLDIFTLKRMAMDKRTKRTRNRTLNTNTED